MMTPAVPVLGEATQFGHALVETCAADRVPKPPKTRRFANPRTHGSRTTPTRPDGRPL